jgi:putative oxidoreductase
MSSDVFTHDSHHGEAIEPVVTPAALQLAVPIGRALFASIFLATIASHFSRGTFGYAASNGVPMASILVPLSGVIAIAGGASILLGYMTRVGAALVVLFLVPVTLLMHDFWNVSDAAMAQVQQIMFMKNVSMLGGALLLLYHGGGPFSVDTASKHRSGP